MGIDKTLEVFESLGSLAATGLQIAKGGIGIGSIGKILDVMKDINELVKDIPAALPELQDIDGAEAARIGQAAYGLVKKILAAAKA
jgi:hypothetical protein